jgi:hypothetical protein
MHTGRVREVRGYDIEPFRHIFEKLVDENAIKL